MADFLASVNIPDSRYCPKCEQCNDNPSIHAEFCKGVIELRQGRSYKTWYAEVNDAVLKIAKVGADDLADSDYWDSWDAGLSPVAMAYKVLEENGFPDELETGEGD